MHYAQMGTQTLCTVRYIFRVYIIMRYEKNNAEGGNDERRLVLFVWNAWPIVVIVRLWHLLVVI